MACSLVLTITILGQTFTTERIYTGFLVSINKTTYTVDFSSAQEWITKPITVPKTACSKAD